MQFLAYARIIIVGDENMYKFSDIYENEAIFYSEMFKYRPFAGLEISDSVERMFTDILYTLSNERGMPTLYSTDLTIDEVRREFGRRYMLYSYLPMCKYTQLQYNVAQNASMGFMQKGIKTIMRDQESSSTNTALVKDAQTPTTSGLSTTYVDDYSDSQSKSERESSDTGEEHITEVDMGNGAYMMTQINKLPYDLIADIQNIFRDCFWNYLNDLDDIDDF